MVYLNDGRGNRLDVHTGNASVLALALVSGNLTGMYMYYRAHFACVLYVGFRLSCLFNVGLIPFVMLLLCCMLVLCLLSY